MSLRDVYCWIRCKIGVWIFCRIKKCTKKRKWLEWISCLDLCTSGW